MKFICSIVFGISLFSSLAVQSQSLPETAKRTIEGSVINVLNSPITLSEASMEVIENQPVPHRSSILQQQVRLLNNTDREIKKVGLAFSIESSNGGLGVSSSVMDWNRLQDGGLYLGHTKMQLLEPNITESLTVRILGISLADGSRWVPPRSYDHLMYSSILSNRNSPIRIYDWRKISNDYRMKMKLTADNIVAYRMGVLKDTPQEFSVRLGEWINLDLAAITKNKEIEILGLTEKFGFRKEDIFKPDLHTRYSRTGQAIKLEHGVAFFVAEVRFADGKVWQQNIAREFLVWDE